MAAPEYAHRYSLQFTATHMLITYNSPGKTGTQSFELCRTRPADVFPRGVQSVRTPAGRVLEFGGIRDDVNKTIHWVCWPVES